MCNLDAHPTSEWVWCFVWSSMCVLRIGRNHWNFLIRIYPFYDTDHILFSSAACFKLVSHSRFIGMLWYSWAEVQEKAVWINQFQRAFCWRVFLEFVFCFNRLFGFSRMCFSNWHICRSPRKFADSDSIGQVESEIGFSVPDKLLSNAEALQVWVVQGSGVVVFCSTFLQCHTCSVTVLFRVVVRISLGLVSI